MAETDGAHHHRVQPGDGGVGVDQHGEGLAVAEVLWTEDMHSGLVVDGSLTIRNPFA